MQAQTNATASDQQQSSSKPGPILLRFDHIDGRDEPWLWQGRIPLGSITTLVGYGGEGKSLLSSAIAAHVTRGTPFIDHTPCPQGAVVVLAGEDRPKTLKKRYETSGADIAKVHLLRGQLVYNRRDLTEVAITLRDIDAIRVALEQVGDCKLLIVDPIGDFIPGIDSNKDNEVRSLLSPLAALAEEHELAVLMISHRKKNSGDRADNMALGSVAFTAKARSVLHLMADPTDQRCAGKRKLILPGKCNDADPPLGLAFEITPPDGKIEWASEPTTLTATEALRIAYAKHKANHGPDAEARLEAEAFLRSALQNGPRWAKELFAEAKEGEGISQMTLRRAQKRLGVVSYRPRTPGAWAWRIPTGQKAG
jgi:putative DNA primase/helicase